MSTDKAPEESGLILVRHGETDSNAQDVWQGNQGDDPLNERGRLQCLATANFLREYRPVDALYSSDLLRAVETAEAIGAQVGLSVKTHSGLREFDFGSLEGATTADALKQWQALLREWRSDPTARSPGGESAFDFAIRVNGAFQEIIGRHPSEWVIVVGHGGSLSMGLAMLFGDPAGWQKYHMSNCGISTVALSESPVILEFDVTTHLAEAGTRTWDGANV